MNDAKPNFTLSFTEEPSSPDNDQEFFTGPSLTDQLTVEALVDLQCPKDACISPSGEHVIYCLESATKRTYPKSELWIATIGQANSARLLTPACMKDDSPRWSNDSETIAFVSDQEIPGKTSAIYLVSLAIEGEPVPVTDPNNEQRISKISWSPDGLTIAFLSADELSTGKRSKKAGKDDAFVYHGQWKYNRLRIVRIGNPDVLTLSHGDRHVTDFAWNSNSTQLVYASQMTPDVNSPWDSGITIGRVSLDTQRPVFLASFPGEVSHLTWCESQVYFLAGRTPDKTCTASTIYRMTQDGEDLIPYAFGDKNCATDLRWMPEFPAAHVQQGLEDRIYRLSETSPVLLHSGLHAIITWDIVGCGRNGWTLVIGKGSPSRPTEIFSVQGSELSQLSQHGQAIAHLQVASEAPFYASASDGVDLDGILLTPTQNRPMPWPTVVAIHGGPPERVTFAFDIPLYHWAPWLASKGYAVLCPNYRGSTSHGEDFVAHSRGGVGTKDYDDIISMIQAGIQRGIVDPNRVGIIGYSQGGFLSYLAVTRPDFRFRAAVCGGGITDWDMLTMSSDFPIFQSELAPGGAPWAVSKPRDTATRHASPIWHMKDVNTPILMLHAEADERIPLSQAIAFHRGCIYHNVVCELVVYPREPHVIAERWHRIDMLRRIENFFALHMT